MVQRDLGGQFIYTIYIINNGKMQKWEESGFRINGDKKKMDYEQGRG